jgi:hypothetical protein
MENIMAELAAGALTVQAVIRLPDDRRWRGAFYGQHVDSAPHHPAQGVFANERRRLWQGSLCASPVLKTDPAAVVVPASGAGGAARPLCVCDQSDLTVAIAGDVARRAGGEIVIADGLEAG